MLPIDHTKDISRKEKRPLSKPLPETERGFKTPLPYEGRGVRFVCKFAVSKSFPEMSKADRLGNWRNLCSSNSV
jgi:hypothetical protein